MAKQTTKPNKLLFSAGEVVLFILATLFGGVLLYYGSASAEPLPRSSYQTISETGFPPKQYRVMASLPLAYIDLSEARQTMASDGFDWFDDFPTTTVHRTWIRDAIDGVTEGYDVMYVPQGAEKSERNVAFIITMQWGEGRTEFIEQGTTLLQRIWQWVKDFVLGIYQSIFPDATPQDDDQPKNPSQDISRWLQNWARIDTSGRGYDIYAADSLVCDQAEWMDIYNVSAIRAYKKFYLEAVEFFKQVAQWHIKVNEFADEACSVVSNQRADEASEAGTIGEKRSDSWWRVYQNQKEGCIKNFSPAVIRDHFTSEAKAAATAMSDEFYSTLRRLQEQLVSFQDIVIPTRWELIATYVAKQACSVNAFENGYFNTSAGYDIYAISPYWNVTRQPLIETVFLPDRDIFEAQLRELGLASEDRDRPGGWLYLDDKIRLIYAMVRDYPVDSTPVDQFAPQQQRLEQRLAWFGLTETNLRQLNTRTGSKMLVGGPPGDWAGDGLSKLF